MSNITKFSEEVNAIHAQNLVKNDEEGVIEAIMRLSVEHGMPVENISGFMFDLLKVINTWSENRNND